MIGDIQMKTSPKYPEREVYISAKVAGVALVSAQTAKRRVTRSVPCVVRAELRCTYCSRTWTVHFRGRKHWRRCPAGCNAHRLRKT
jgi:hypothetical protein